MKKNGGKKKHMSNQIINIVVCLIMVVFITANFCIFMKIHFNI